MSEAIISFYFFTLIFSHMSLYVLLFGRLCIWSISDETKPLGVWFSFECIYFILSHFHFYIFYFGKYHLSTTLKFFLDVSFVHCVWMTVQLTGSPGTGIPESDRGPFLMYKG